MTIAPELRNSIYELVLLAVQTVRIGAGGRLTNQPGLLATCRQVRGEALPIFTYLAPMVALCKVNVHNLDFTQLIAFADGLDAELRKAIRREGRVRVMLSLDEDFSVDLRPAAEANLRIWLQYCGDNELFWHRHAANYDCTRAHLDGVWWIEELREQYLVDNQDGLRPVDGSMGDTVAISETAEDISRCNKGFFQLNIAE
ncbi:hypothetical protein LTS10_005198 [Elasticomyces elasticus]|nr:hypothetical protein LTS10_005198 [Elasticomyces elasticus]